MPCRQLASGASMDQYESTTHPFILKIWLEESAKEAGRATWRGHITHVPSGKQRYLKDLDDITGFIIPYLKKMGVKLGFWRHVRQMLRRRKVV